MNKDIAGLSGHYVVCGFGHTGRRVAEELRRRGHRVVVADIDEAAVSQAVVNGFPALQGDSGSDDTLRRAGVDRAAGAVVAVAADADALMTVISARSLNKEMVVVARATDESNEPKFRLAGANSVLPVHQMAGHNLAQMVTQPEFAAFLEAVLSEDGIELETTVVRVTETSLLLNRTLDESGLTEQADTTVFGIRNEDGRPTVISRHGEALKVGDIIVIIGTRQQLTELRKKAGAVSA
jgi:voltage-gated potassium channel